jgi:hypothetical protein
MLTNSSQKTETINDYFKKLHAVIEENNICPKDIWNIDETGFRLGIGIDQIVVTCCQ